MEKLIITTKCKFDIMELEYCILYDRKEGKTTTYESLNHLINSNIAEGHPKVSEELTSIEESDGEWRAELTTTYHIEDKDKKVETATGYTVFDVIERLGVGSLHPNHHEILVPKAHVEDAAEVLEDLDTGCTHTDTLDLIAKVGASIGVGPGVGVASLSFAEIEIPPTIGEYDVALYCRTCHELLPRSEFGR